MAIVTSFKSQKKSGRVNVYLDDEFGFGIDLDNFVLLGLRVGQELSQEEIISIVKKAEFQKTLNKVLRFASVRPRSKKEITLWLKRKEVHESIHNELFDRLKHFELLDDAKFAAWWVDQRVNFKNKSKKVIALELRQKGVDSMVIEDALTISTVNEESTAAKLLSKKSYKWDKFPEKEKTRKEQEYLMRHGFSWDVIEKITKK